MQKMVKTFLFRIEFELIFETRKLQETKLACDTTWNNLERFSLDAIT